MPKILKKFVFTGRGRYPWDEWADGQCRELIAGEDFGADIKVQGLANQAHGQAKKRGMKVRTQISDKGLVIQFVAAE